MCGIAGILSKSGENVVPLVGAMLSCMANRGPDGAGLIADGQIFKSNSIATMQPEFQKVSAKTRLQWHTASSFASRYSTLR